MVDIASVKYPDSVSSLNLGNATPEAQKSFGVVIVFVNNGIAGVCRPYVPIRANCKLRKGRKLIKDLVKDTSRKIEAEDVRATVCPPYVSAAHVYVAKEPGLLVELARAIVVTIDLGGSVESPYLIWVAVVAVPRTDLDEIKQACNLGEVPESPVLGGAEDTSLRRQPPNFIRLGRIASANRNLGETGTAHQYETFSVEDVRAAIG
jgi:hypothetical protein